MITRKEIIEKTAETLLRASTVFRPDQIDAYKRAAELEDSKHAKWVLENIIKNAEIAEDKVFPLCDDTGIPHVLVEVGEDAAVPAGFFSAVEEGVAAGLRQLPGRPMAVKGNDYERISQSAGLSEDSGDLAMAPIQIRRISGKKIRLTLMMYGGGPEIRGKTLRVFHKHSADTVINEMIEWAVEGAKLLGCLPCVLSFGIGRSNLEAASLSMEAMAKGNFSVQSDIEKKITEEVNKAGYGALGLGGKTTALATFVKVG
ncbi:MAG: fumarate hydratase, partial [Synergistaceae bacterium]